VDNFSKAKLNQQLTLIEKISSFVVNFMDIEIA